MRLAELADYAKNKYGIREEHKWADFPGFSVLTDPYSGKWAALMMQRWDQETGEISECCDIKCGRQTLSEYRLPYLTESYRMRGQKWIGVRFEDNTDRDLIFLLFDRAVRSGEQRGYTISLGPGPVRKDTLFGSVPIRRGTVMRQAQDPDMPDMIRDMIRLYEYGDGSFHQKCKNFYLQGMFMKDYEDDYPWTGQFSMYFPTYHDLNHRQLRGYFSWRKDIRNGIFRAIPTSAAYIYIFELINGIGVSSAAESIRKLGEFETGFIDAGIGNPDMKKNIRRWMLDLSVVNALPAETAVRMADQAMIRRDAEIAVLKEPEAYSDAEVCAALALFAGAKPENSPVIRQGGNRGEHLFAAVWRQLSENYGNRSGDIFTLCFGARTRYPWHPLSNAVFFDRGRKHENAVYELDACRRYICRDGRWTEERYDSLQLDKKKLREIWHETDRILRKYLKTGYYLKAKPEEAWVSAFAEAAAAADRKAQEEAARPKITIDLSGLSKIREDSIITRDSLLTEADREDREAEVLPAVTESGMIHIEAARVAVHPDAAPEIAKEDPAGPIPAGTALLSGIIPDPVYIRILQSLLDGIYPERLIKDNHIMPSVAADEINEAFFDDFGDNIMECDGDRLLLIDDYTEDVRELLEELNHG